jgi:hypothetical protein
MGTAFGIISVLANVMTVAVPPIIGAIKDHTLSYGYGYTYVELFFTITASFILLNAFCLSRQYKKKLE